jgi:hypothetical protein
MAVQRRVGALAAQLGLFGDSHQVLRLLRQREQARPRIYPVNLWPPAGDGAKIYGFRGFRCLVGCLGVGGGKPDKSLRCPAIGIVEECPSPAWLHPCNQA